MSTTNGPMKIFKVTDKDGNVYVMNPVDTEARQAIDEAKNLQFDEDYFTSDVSQDETTVSVGLNGVPLGVDSDSPLKFAQDNAQGIVIGSDAPFSTAIAQEYDSTSTYAVDDVVMHKGLRYVCTTAITTAEAWNSAHWTAANIEDALTKNRAFYINAVYASGNYTIDKTYDEIISAYENGHVVLMKFINQANNIFIGTIDRIYKNSDNHSYIDFQNISYPDTTGGTNQYIITRLKLKDDNTVSSNVYLVAFTPG